MSVYDFKVKDAKGAEVSLAEYKGKVLLIVNTATGCGLPHSMRVCRICMKNTSHRDWKFWIFHVTNSVIKLQVQKKK